MKIKTFKVERWMNEFEDGSYMHSIVDLYEKGISVGSMSKIFSLAGLRMGWKRITIIFILGDFFVFLRRKMALWKKTSLLGRLKFL